MGNYFSQVLFAFFASIGIVVLIWLGLQLFFLRGNSEKIYLFIPLKKSEQTLEQTLRRVLLSNMPALYDRILLVDCGADQKTIEAAKRLALNYPAISVITQDAVPGYFL